MLVCLTTWTEPGRAAEINKEYLVKAAYITKFVPFVRWPVKSAQASICIIGDSPLAATEAIFDSASQKMGVQFSLVNHVDANHATKECKIVFIGASEQSSLSSILATLKGKPVLTISDLKNFSENGGMIGFVTTDEGNIKFTVNNKPITDAGLNVDSSLLELAVKVIDK